MDFISTPSLVVAIIVQMLVIGALTLMVKPATRIDVIGIGNLIAAIAWFLLATGFALMHSGSAGPAPLTPIIIMILAWLVSGAAGLCAVGANHSMEAEMA